jgi:hypothetical protein
MMKMEFDPPQPQTVVAFMKRVAKRTRMLHPDRHIRTGRTKNFLDDTVVSYSLDVEAGVLANQIISMLQKVGILVEDRLAGLLQTGSFGRELS